MFLRKSNLERKMSELEFVPFTHLHVHSDMSARDGITKIPELIAKAAKNGMTACALTDHGNMQGALEFHNQAKNAGIKSLIGVESYFAPVESVERGEKTPLYHLTLIAKDMAGYRNLIKICSLSYDNFYYFPRVTMPMLEKYGKGVIGLSACLGGELPQLIMNGKFEEAAQRAKWYEQVFDGDFYYEIMRNGYKKQDEVNQHLIKIANNPSKLVATNDVHYLEKEDKELRMMVSKIAQNYDDREEDGELWFKTGSEMLEKLQDMPELLENTVKLADSCEDLELKPKGYIYPAFTPESGKNFTDEIRDNAWEGLKKRGLDENPEYRERLAHELDIIEKYHFYTYLLIVADIIGFARKNHIPVGPGRGSAAGSLVCYCLEITDIDPIRWNLSFERFINPERVSLPDIDMDICGDRREEVIKYLVDKYGDDYVAYISTSSKWAEKGAIRAVSQSMGKNGHGLVKKDMETLCSMIDEYKRQNPDENKSIAEIMETGFFNEIMEKNPLARECLQYASRIEGITNAFGTHAAGIILSDVPISDVVATGIIKDKRVVQCDMVHAEKNCGLIKMDLLGLKTVTIIGKTIDNIIKEGKEPPNIRDLPLDCEDAYKIYATGDTMSVFQMESDGMKKTAQKLRPTCLEDIIALVAMYRPGPIKSGMVDSFIRRKHGQEEISYYGLDRQLEPILKETYGLIIYQEQVMKIAQAIAGYTAGGADILRRAMGKKKPEEMAKQEAVFMDGAAKLGMPEKTVKEIFDAMAQFAKYGFNKSHAAAYAYISYATAYLKSQYPAEFMAAVIDNEKDPEKAGQYIDIARNFCKVVQPDLMLSDDGVTVRDGKIVIGFSRIKGLPSAASEELVLLREKWKKNGTPKNLVELLAESPKFNLKFLETMNKSGALDSYIGGWRNRAIVDSHKVEIKDAAAKIRKKMEKGGVSLLPSAKQKDAENGLSFLGLSKINEDRPIEWQATEAANYEKDVLGICISDINVLDGASLSDINSSHRMKISLIDSYCEGFAESEFKNRYMDEESYFLVIISDFKALPYKSDPSKMFFRMTVEDDTGMTEIKGFDDAWKNMGAKTRESLLNEDYANKIWKMRIYFQKDKENPRVINNFLESKVNSLSIVEKNCFQKIVRFPKDKMTNDAHDALNEIKQKYSCPDNDQNGRIYTIEYGANCNSESFILKDNAEVEKEMDDWRRHFISLNCKVEDEMARYDLEEEKKASFQQLTLF